MSKARVNVQKLNDIFSVTDFGAIGDGNQANATTNVTAIRAAIAAASAADKALYIPSGTYVVNDNFTLTTANNGLTIFGDGHESCIKLANTINYPANLIAAWMFYVSQSVSNVTFKSLRLDGSRSTISYASTSHGIWFGSASAQSTKMSNVSVIDCYTHDFLTQGINITCAGVRIQSVYSYNNTFHGIGVANINNASPWSDGFVQIDVATCYGNGGYGIDFAGGKSIVGIMECYENVSGGSKAATGCEYLQISSAHLYNNTVNGFLTTGNIPNLEAHIEYIECYGNQGNAGLVIGTGKRWSFGEIRCYGNNGPANGNPLEIVINCQQFSADKIYVKAALTTCFGIGIDGTDTRIVRIGYLEARDCAAGAVKTFSAGASTTNVFIESGFALNNNQDNATSGSGCVIDALIPGLFSVTNFTMIDTQASPKQTQGFRFAGGVTGYVQSCVFGTGITSPIFSATTGTRVRFGQSNVGLVTYATGTHTANGGGATFAATFAQTLTTLSNEIVSAQVTPRLQDGSGAHWISAISTTQLTVSYATATPGGTNNVSFLYSVEKEIVVP